MEQPAVNILNELHAEIAELKMQLEEAHDTIEAIRTGQVDALVVQGEDGHQLYTLKSADQTYRVFIEKMNEGALTLNRDGTILYSNSRFAEMVMADLSKVVGMSFLDFVVAEQKENFKKIIEGAWSSDTKGEVLLEKDGIGNTAFLFSINTLELDEGTALSIILADLTRQKESEQLLLQKNVELEAAKRVAEELNNVLEEKVVERTKELSLSREQFKFLADNIPVMAWTALPDGSISYFNKRWYEYTGMQENGLLENWPSVVHSDDLELALSAWKDSLNSKAPFRVEYRLRRASDGNYRWHFGNALPYRNEAGEVIAWFGISSDIDFQKKALEQKDEFISVVSHELKTPVTSLKGFLQLMMAMQKDTDAVQFDYLATMNNQVNKLTRLITDLLDASKFNNGLLKYDKDNFAFNELVTEIVSEMQHTTDSHHIELHLGEPVSIVADRNRIGQVITNLISNAIKYSPLAKTVIVSVEKKGGEIIFCVQDFGIGISKEQQANLYTRFYRVQENNGNSFPGMGLGLYISMGIVEKHGGKMWLESVPGEGSLFYFSLPLG
jgi:two-component system, OmpR family, phosphate regulon sensor histidine kinase PhoR